MKLIIGLGNIGDKYKLTRHNIGFIFLDNLALKYNLSYLEKFNSYYVKFNLNGEEVIFLKPKTYMNNSGLAIREVMNFFKIKRDDILVIYDDLDLDFGRIKLKYNSSSGGHNGIKSIISHVGSQEFMRVKFGINNEYRRDTKNFVLDKFSKKELSEINDYNRVIEDIVEDFIKGNDHLDLMNKYN